MKFCILQTEVDKETLDFLYENGYPIDRIQTEDGEYMYKTPALLCKNFKVNDEIRTYDNGLLSMFIENTERKKGIYKTGDLLIDVETHTIQKGEEKLLISKAAFVVISTLIMHPHKTISRGALVFSLEQAYHHQILDNTLTVYVAMIRRILGKNYVGTHKTIGYFWAQDVIKVG